MKIYTIVDYYPDGYTKGIHSAYLSKDKAQSVSDELRKYAYEADIHDIMVNEQITKDDAIEWVNKNFPTWLYQVKEIEVEE